MYWENLDPLFRIWPILVMVLGIVLLGVAWTIWTVRQPRREHMSREKRYWIQEMRWRARVKAFGFLNRVRAPRLTDQRDRKD